VLKCCGEKRLGESQSHYRSLAYKGSVWLLDLVKVIDNHSIIITKSEKKKKCDERQAKSERTQVRSSTIPLSATQCLEDQMPLIQIIEVFCAVLIDCYAEVVEVQVLASLAYRH
jgi:hypothetical protein